MINCTLDLQTSPPEINNKFSSFRIDSLDNLIPKIQSKLDDLSLSFDANVPEMNIHIKLSSQEAVDQIIGLNPNLLSHFILSQEKFLLRFFFDVEPPLDVSRINPVQQRCEQSFLEALKRKYSLPKKRHRIALTELFADGLPDPSLNKSIDISEPNSSSPIVFKSPSSLPKLKTLSIPAVVTPIVISLEDPFFADLVDILEKIPSDKRSRIGASLGKEGLRDLCYQFKKIFTPEQFGYVYSRFFQTEQQEQQLFALLLPSGSVYLKCLKAWPKTLVEYWISWLQQDTVSPLTFTDAAQQMQDFWLSIKDFYPSIPSVGAMTAFNYSARLNAMKGLVDKVKSPFKKFQAEALFKLSGPSLTNYQAIMDRTGAQWICQEMFNPDLVREPVKYDVRQQLIEPGEVSYYQWSTQHIKDNSETVGNVFEYPKFIKILPLERQAKAWQLAAWCVSLPQLFKKEDFIKIYREFEKLSPESAQDLLNFLFSLSNERRQSFNIATWQKLFSVIKGNSNLLLKAMRFYDIWQQKLSRTHISSWETILAYLMQCNDHVKIDYVLSLASEELSSEQLYFKALLGMFIEHTPPNLESLNQLLIVFNGCSPELKANLIAVLSSYQLQEGRSLNLEGLGRVIRDLQANQPMEGAFVTHLAGFTFNYFKSVIDYNLVLNKMEEVFTSVKAGLDWFLSGERILFPFSIKNLLHEETLAGLTAQQTDLANIQDELNRLKNLRSGIDVSALFVRFKAFDTFFMDFMKKPLGNIFTGSLFTLLKNLDKSLSANSTMRAMIKILYEKHSFIPSKIARWISKENLKILNETSESTPLMQKFLKIYLVDPLAEAIQRDLNDRLRTSVIPLAERKKLTNFLAELPLESQALNDFFVRYQAIQMITKSWPSLEADLIELTNQDTIPLIWKALIDEQLSDGTIYSSAHWHIGIRFLKEWVAVVRGQPADSPMRVCSLSHVCAAFFKAKSSLKTIEVASNGELRHPHMNQLFEHLFAGMQEFGQNPYFLHLLPQAIEHILQNGTPYNFARNIDSFGKLGGNHQLLQKLMAFSAIPANKPHVENILSSFSLAIEKEKATQKPWGMLFNRILNFADLEANLPHVHDALGWLFENDKFPWLQLILDDKEASCQKVVDLVRLMKTQTLWTKAYHKDYGIAPVPASVPEVVTSAPKPWFFTRIYRWARGTTPASVRPLQPTPEVVIPSYIQKSWPLWQKPNYPSLEQINRWMGLSEEAFLREQETFERYPVGPLEAYVVPDEDINRWMKELQCYDYFAPEKSKIESRLKKLLLRSNQLFSEKRTELKDKILAFKKLERNLAQDEQDELLATIVALYYKVIQKKPYPPQLLSLLVNLEYNNKNMVLEVDTGEGKGITTALMAILKWSLRKDATVEIRTANRDLVRQDYLEKGHWRLFEFLDIPSGMIQENSDPRVYQAGGIYYATQEDMMVFKELHRNQPREKFPQDIDVIVDEIDHVILDQTSMINLSKKTKDTRDFTWFYQAINQFIDAQMTNPSQKYSLKKWGILLKQALEHEFQAHPKRLEWINQHSTQKWQDWIELGVYAKSLKENQHFIVEAVESGFQVVPYINHEIKYGYELSYQLKTGLKQLLHARLSTGDKHFKVEAEDQIISQISPADFREANSFIGMSGSIGSLSECYELKESLGASAVRISRQYSSKLEESPLVLESNQTALDETLYQKILAETNPVLVCFPEIEDAVRFERFLKSKFNDTRPIRLLTGQESQMERSAWLHQKSNEAYAGSPNAITIATPICGRGTDISVAEGHRLSIMQVGVLEPRNMVQLRGRTARNNKKGHYQLFLNQQQIPEGMDNVQQNLMARHRETRLQFRLKSWLKSGLFQHVNPILAMIPDQRIRDEYWLEASQCLEQLASIKELNIQDSIIAVVAIMKTMVAKLRLAGYVSGTDQPEGALNRYLLANRENWIRMVKSPEGAGRFEIQKPLESSEFSEVELVKFKEDFGPQIPTSFRSAWLTWFYDNEPMTLQTVKVLEDTWHTFKTTPNSETWASFYQALQAGQEYAQLQEKESGWFKWMKPKSYLSPWLKVANLGNFLIQMNKTFKDKSDYFYTTVKTEINLRLTSTLASTGWRESIKVFLYNLFSFLNSKTAKLVQDVKEKNEAFGRNPTQQSMLDLWQALFYLSEECKNSKSWSSGSLTHWLFWSQHCQTYLNLYANLPQWIAQDGQLSSSVEVWREKQSTIGHFQLMYRTQVMHQIKHHELNLSQKGFWSKFQVKNVEQHQQYQQELRAKDITSKTRVSLELDELVRAFPNEIRFLYAQYQRNRLQDNVQEKTLKWMLLSIFQAKFNPLAIKFNHDIESGRLKAFCAELQKWSNCRELLVEWDRINPSHG